jgi:hypothetical protein
MPVTPPDVSANPNYYKVFKYVSDVAPAGFRYLHAGRLAVFQDWSTFTKHSG